MARTRSVVLVVATLALVVSACTGGDPAAEPTRASSPTPSAASTAPVEPPATLTARPSPTAEVPTDGRPNLLVIETDDMRADELRWMPKTRRLIGGQGLTFRNSFAPNPLCCPSRTSFLTGKYSHNHRVLSHEDPYGFGSFDDRTTLATRLQDSGYRTALVGKYLNGYGIQPTFGAGKSSTSYVPPGWTQWWAGLDDSADRVGGTYSYFHLTSNVNGEVRSWPGRYSTDVMAEQTQDLVRRFTRSGSPWFIWWNPVAPHHGGPFESDDPGTVRRRDGFPVKWVTPARPDYVKGRFDDQIRRGAGVRPGRPTEGDMADKPFYLRRQPELSPREEDAVRTVTRQRAEALAVLDDRVADTLRRLRTLGQAQRTIVVFTSDNGYYLGEHRKRQGKINLHEPSIRVPLLMRGPDVPQGDRFDPITTVDLAATLAAYAGVRLPSADGADLRETIAAGDVGWRRALVLEGRMPEARYLREGDARPFWAGLNTAGLRSGRWKLVRYSTGERELYDLSADPLELSSLPVRRRVPLQQRLERLWERYVQCAGDGCRRPLPRELWLSPEENARVTLEQERRERAYYGR